MLNEPHSEEPFLEWARREWLLVLITVGIGIDWLPFMLTGVLPQLAPLSGTRFLVIPGLVLAFLKRPSRLSKPPTAAFAYFATLLIGGGLGWLADTVSTGRLTTLVVNGFILLYYMQVRSLISILRILQLTFVLSFGVPIIQCLAALGIITEPWLLSLGAPPGGGRIFSIFDTTTPGFIPLMIPACLGGLIFFSDRARFVAVKALLASGLVAFGVTSALVAQQRSGVLAYAASLGAAVLLDVRSNRKRLIQVLLGFALVGLIGAYAARGVYAPATQRFSDAAAFADAKDLRTRGFLTFLSDFAKNPLNPVPIGPGSLLDRTGVAPHLLVSEAYYTGGPLFLVVILALLFKSARASVRLAWSSDARARTIGSCLSAFGTGFAIEIMLQTSLGLRIVPLILGVAIAAERVLRAEARTVPALPASRVAEAR